MLRFQKILCPTDFSEDSTQALEAACELAATFQCELHLLHVFEGYDTIVLNPNLAMTPMATWLPQLRQLCREKLSELPGREWQTRCTVVRVNHEGSPIVEILNYARANRIDLIVMATHGRTGLKHLLLGSVAENIVRHASCPVLTMRVREPTSANPKNVTSH